MHSVFKPQGGLHTRCRWLGRFLQALCFLFLTEAQASAQSKSIGFFVGDTDAYACARALSLLTDIPTLEVRIFTEADIGGPIMTEFVKRMDAAVVDIMGRRLGPWLLENKDIIRPGSRIYIVRTGRRPEDFIRAGFLIDRKVRAYFDYTSAENIVNLLRFLADRDFGLKTAYRPPVIPAENALYHPDAPRLFGNLAECLGWYQSSGRYQPDGLWDLILVFPTSTLEARKSTLDALMRAYERYGINTVAMMQELSSLRDNLDMMINADPLKNRIGSITAEIFKFSSTISNDLISVLTKANVPVLNAQHLYFNTGENWLASDQGISPMGLTYQFSTPELFGLVEPTVIGVKEQAQFANRVVTAFRYLPVEAQIEKLARRAARWHALRKKPNRDKKIVLIYYNHSAGKQNIGATYLNVFRSITEIIRRLKREGYFIPGNLTEEKVKDLLLKSGRNIGSWAPDELDRLVAEGNAVFINMADYKKWFAETPADYQKKTESDWGKPEDSKIMLKDGRFVIPCIRLGNLILVPQPVRGFSADPNKLYHSTVLYPHHQYTAFYLWLQKVVQPDAMISLGTHGTHEWLPGKQAGLSPQCPPEVLIGDIPNLYPYIVDDVGEGIQAKRRGRGVIIDYAVPPLRRAGLYEEYLQLLALINEHEASSSDRIRSARLERIREAVVRLGIDKDLELTAFDQETLQRIRHYLLEIDTDLVPYGMHTFGVSSSGAGLIETASAMAQKGDRSAGFYKTQLEACGPSEMKSLVQGLSGGYVPPASGNDPVRNPESLPTGKNFYAFDPQKVPSKEAWENGKKAGLEIIQAYRQKHQGKAPEQVGLILWAMETIRDEGINVATSLYLMGMMPVWDQRDKVTGVVPISAAELNRPRIDVLLQMSGLFRDTFPQVALMLDQAVKKAAALNDLVNFIRKHSQALERALIAEGRSLQEAKKLSLVRLYSAPPGAYGNKVADMTGASGLWEDDRAVADQGFVQRVSFGYSSDIWGQRMTRVYRQHLKSTDATVHTISSNLFGTMDTDDMFGDLGGLSLAVRRESGKDPEVFISMQRTLGQGRVEPVALSLGRELRTRYLNPKWIDGMKKESYAGARQMSNFMEYLWGWQVTTPSAVDQTKWEQAFEVYVEDKYGLDLHEFFDRENPWAYQSITARMLEVVRKEYWRADDQVTQKLATEYALNVVEKGVACCDHTCNNPMLNQMVVNIISLPGVLSPAMLKQFKLKVEQAAKKPLEQQVTERKQLLAELREGLRRTASEAPDHEEKDKTKRAEAGLEERIESVEGYKMEDMKKKDDTTNLTSSGIQWAASLFVLLIIGLFVWGSLRRS